MPDQAYSNDQEGGDRTVCQGGGKGDVCHLLCTLVFLFTDEVRNLLVHQVDGAQMQLHGVKEHEGKERPGSVLLRKQ